MAETPLSVAWTHTEPTITNSGVVAQIQDRVTNLSPPPEMFEGSLAGVTVETNAVSKR